MPKVYYKDGIPHVEARLRHLERHLRWVRGGGLKDDHPDWVAHFYIPAVERRRAGWEKALARLERDEKDKRVSARRGKK